MPKDDKSADEAAQGGVYRPRFTIPETYGFVRRWIAGQRQPSISFVLVLRDWIERNGYGDVLNRPVEQLPRRGRPPGGDPQEQSRPSGGQIGDAEDAEDGDVRAPIRRIDGGGPDYGDLPPGLDPAERSSGTGGAGESAPEPLGQPAPRTGTGTGNSVLDDLL